MADISGQPGELQMTIQITRKDTGKVEEVDLVGYLNPEQLVALQAAETKTQEN